MELKTLMTETAKKYKANQTVGLVEDRRKEVFRSWNPVFRKSQSTN